MLYTKALFLSLNCKLRSKGIPNTLNASIPNIPVPQRDEFISKSHCQDKYSPASSQSIKMLYTYISISLLEQKNQVLGLL